MTEAMLSLTPRRVGRIAVLVVLGSIAIALEAAPVGPAPRALPSPDLLFCVVAYWAIRRPGSVPVPVVFLLGLMRDLATDAPVGAGAVSLVLGVEILRAWRGRLMRSMFLQELLAVAACALVMVAVQLSVVVITLARPPYLTDLAQQVAFTAMAYPVLVLIARVTVRLDWRRDSEPS